MHLLMVAVFVLGYAAIASENLLKINKAASALLAGAVCWTILILGSPDKHEVYLKFLEHTGSIAGILFFLMAAMTIVETINVYSGFDAIAEKLTATGNRRLLWIVSILTFFLSSVLDNLTTTIVMVSLLTKLVKKREDLLMFVGIVIIAANAGGAWTPIGDVTTTMLWIGGQLTTFPMLGQLVVPSLVCLVAPVVVVSLRIKSGDPSPRVVHEDSVPKTEQFGRNLVFVLGILCLLFVPVFKGFTGLPPYLGIVFALGVLWVVTEVLRRKGPQSNRETHSVARALHRVDMTTILFFLGILLAVAALESAGLLSALGLLLEKRVGSFTAIVFSIGLLSAVIDNVPLVAAAMNMYPLSHIPVDDHFWMFLSYCAGTGGSILVIGSAAGVAAMGLVKIDFFWYLKKISPLAFLGYVAGAIAYLVQGRLF